MKNILNFILIILTTMLLFSCSRNTAPQDSYQRKQVVADGMNNDEWDFPLRLSNNDYTLSYNITNDDKKIYIVIFSKDNEMQKRILKAGISIFFDKKGEKNTRVVLNYPERNNESFDDYESEYDSTKYSKKVFENLDVYWTRGFINTEDGQHKINNNRNRNNQIKLGLKENVDSGLLYEAIIPIEEVLPDGFTAKNLKKNFSIGIDVHTLQQRINNYARQENSRNDSYRPQIRPNIGIGIGGGGMGMGGGMGSVGFGINMGGGMRGGGGRNYNRNEQKQPGEILWYQFRFSTQK